MALDDVGADHRSLALMPFIAPEVIKLDLRLVQDNPSPAIAAIVHAVNAQSERSGAVLLAEGIETEEQLAVAPGPGRPLRAGLALRAPGRTAAGHGRPARADRSALGDASRAGLALRRRRRSRAPAPRFEGAAAGDLAPPGGAGRRPGRVRGRLRGVPARPPLHSRSQPRATRRWLPPQRWSALSASACPPSPPRASAAPTSTPTTRLAGEWNVTVIAPHFAAAFVARDLGDTECADMERRFDFCLTYDRDLAIEAARGLLARIAPR